MTVTVGIKALNEEAHIADAIRSALAAVAPLNGEVVLADSGSSDATIAIARRFPIRIVQLRNPADACCGAGAQLAFQTVDTEFFYLLDGDMTLDPDFLPAAIALMRKRNDLAGVGGLMTEHNAGTQEFRIRVAEMRKWKAGDVAWLDGGGLYRTKAICEVGYLADRNLKSFEEFDLGARLHAKGWRLARIAVNATEHTAHGGGGYRLMIRRLKSGQMTGSGGVIRASLEGGYFPFVARRLGHLRSALAVLCWWLAILAAASYWPLGLVPLLLVPLVFLTWRRRSLNLGLYSFVYWNASAAMTLLGMVRPRKSPRDPLSVRVIASDEQ
ncbi:glycosyltransferase family 2 protein [Stakelama tenebrarum]|uniref:Glycosyltransferase n=1 Tax=Stakelama tenebrarum TaxID=2711215 RepID=A0A6G6Y3N1_9SPHN|nr:glycosyltransferase [Sphingosinithalassobacter tenebrarum]QIG79525.1 glycosyltransferase [Sphingosinithalassobacter tenebrarum]